MSLKMDHIGNPRDRAPLYYVAVFGFKKKGPLRADEILSEIRRGRLHGETKAWKSNSREWQRLGTMPEFSSALREMPPSLLQNTLKEYVGYFSGASPWWWILIGFFALIAFVPFDQSFTPDSDYNWVFLIKDPESKGLWPIETEFVTLHPEKWINHLDDRGMKYYKEYYTFNGIFAGFDLLEFVVLVFSMASINVLLKRRMRRRFNPSHENYINFPIDDHSAKQP